MYVDHLRKDFYDHLLGKRVVMIANHDVDAVCATKILQFLFQIDDISYVLVTAQGISELKQEYETYKTITRTFILINCGGTIDVMDLFGNPTDCQIFIIDSHRPTHILNIYDESGQVRIISPVLEDEEIPKFDDIFREEGESDDSEESDDELEDEEDEENDEDAEDEDEGVGDVEDVEGDGLGGRRGQKRKRTNLEKHQRSVQRRKQKRDWEERRRRILFDYTQHSYYSVPAALIALEVAWTMSREDADIVWWAIVGLTEYFVLNRVERANYTLLVSQLQQHVARITHANNTNLSVLKITFENELNLFLYRHWSLYQSMKCTPAWICKFKLWSVKGEQKFHEFLAEVGLPLAEVRQVYTSMDYTLRKELKTIINARADKYSLTDDVCFGSFFAQFGYTYKYSALDNYLAAMALLEQPSEEIAGPKRFLNALNSLSKTNKDDIKTGIECAKLLMPSLIKQVQAFLDLKQINVVNPIIFVVIQEGTLDSKYFTKPLSLTLLANYTLRAFINSNPQRKNLRQFPLVLLAPKGNGEFYSVVGIPPITVSVTQNLLGKAFEQVALRLTNSVVIDTFDNTMIQVKSAEKDKFMEILIGILS